MHGTTAELRTVGEQLDRLRAANPEWHAWLELVGRALSSAESAPWTATEVALPAARPHHAPLLHGATIRLPARAAGRWLRRLLRDAGRADWPGAAALRRARLRRLDALALLGAAATGRTARITALADHIGLEADALAAIAHIAALPLLMTARARTAAAAPPDWSHGYCPTCGSWPVLAELRGLDRKRWLRCGRCGDGWVSAWLRCPFCDEKRHDRLGSLVPEREDDTRRVEKCESCRGYLKTITTLQATAPGAVPLEDLHTLELDIAAREQGYDRPELAGWMLDFEIAGIPAAWPL